MYAEKEFEEWWKENISKGKTLPKESYQLVVVYSASKSAFLAGCQSGIDSVNSLPHRAMFDAGVEYGISQGRREGLEEAAKLVESKRWENRNDCAEAIRQRIEEGK